MLKNLYWSSPKYSHKKSYAPYLQTDVGHFKFPHRHLNSFSFADQCGWCGSVSLLKNERLWPWTETSVYVYVTKVPCLQGRQRNTCFRINGCIPHTIKKVVTQQEVCLQPGFWICLCAAPRLVSFCFFVLFVLCTYLIRRRGYIAEESTDINAGSFCLFFFHYESFRGWRINACFIVTLNSPLWLLDTSKQHLWYEKTSLANQFVVFLGLSVFGLLNNKPPIKVRLYWLSPVVHLPTTRQIHNSFNGIRLAPFVLCTSVDVSVCCWNESEELKMLTELEMMRKDICLKLTSRRKNAGTHRSYRECVALPSFWTYGFMSRQRTGHVHSETFFFLALQSALGSQSWLFLCQ